MFLCGFISNKISYDVHTTKPIHLRYHLNDKPHGALLGHQSFTYLYPILIGCVFCVDFVPKLLFKKKLSIFTSAALFILPILQVISYFLYIAWYYYEPPLPLIPAFFFIVAGVFNIKWQPSKKPESLSPTKVTDTTEDFFIQSNMRF